MQTTPCIISDAEVDKLSLAAPWGVVPLEKPCYKHMLRSRQLLALMNKEWKSDTPDIHSQSTKSVTCKNIQHFNRI